MEAIVVDHEAEDSAAFLTVEGKKMHCAEIHPHQLGKGTALPPLYEVGMLWWQSGKLTGQKIEKGEAAIVQVRRNTQELRQAEEEDNVEVGITLR